ncbi:hypothetical protein L596_001128 [Steinernema carpocapsae]|uniref:Uncharacterized protein n=1 Tax=Steinernema carpocapsae TaxID=34508 RepID=A0A4U8UK21_STECR|nr:hypothetical protein L596_001128 [Steinernema carpocapsae]
MKIIDRIRSWFRKPKSRKSKKILSSEPSKNTKPQTAPQKKPQDKPKKPQDTPKEPQSVKAKSNTMSTHKSTKLYLTSFAARERRSKIIADLRKELAKHNSSYEVMVEKAKELDD